MQSAAGDEGKLPIVTVLQTSTGSQERLRMRGTCPVAPLPHGLVLTIHADSSEVAGADDDDGVQVEVERYPDSLGQQVLMSRC